MDNREKTDAYVKGQMDQTERAAFQRDMLKDPALADAVDTTRTELQLANALVREQIQQWFREWNSAQTPASSQVPPPKRQTFPWLLARWRCSSYA
jgi:anti-sigma factor RsiW